MTEIRSLRADDAPRLTGLLAQLGYPTEPSVMAHRMVGILSSTTQQVLVAAPRDMARIDGYIGVERRLTLHSDEHAEIIDLVVDSAIRRSGLGRTLVNAAEQWALQHDLHTIIVSSNVVRPESHPFYEALGYQPTTTSHTYRKEV